jgi:hypothetical protein
VQVGNYLLGGVHYSYTLFIPNWGESAFNHLTHRCLFLLGNWRKLCPNAGCDTEDAGVRDRITRFAPDSEHPRAPPPLERPQPGKTRCVSPTLPTGRRLPTSFTAPRNNRR